ncbi:hypothetical protein [Kordia sp.]|uniref:hypothetical protein n=1 Tax=Kordia sp. TaxID=1965332 RepID=UPI003B5C5FA7
MKPNAQEIKISGTGKANITIKGRTYASFLQDVGVSYDNAGPRFDEFQGSGEDVPFKNHVILKDVQLPISFGFLFRYSDNGGKTFQPAQRSQKKETYIGPAYEIYKISSEDAIDNDNNDSVMYLSVDRI